MESTTIDVHILTPDGISPVVNKINTQNNKVALIPSGIDCGSSASYKLEIPPSSDLKQMTVSLFKIISIANLPLQTYLFNYVLVKVYSTLFDLFLKSGDFDEPMPIIFENSLGFGSGFAAAFTNNILYQSWSRTNNACYNCKYISLFISLFLDLLDGEHILKMCRYIAKNPKEIVKWMAIISKKIVEFQKASKECIEVIF